MWDAKFTSKFNIIRDVAKQVGEYFWEEVMITQKVSEKGLYNSCA